MTSVIQIHGRPFSIGFSDSDDTRRKAYFKNSMGNLTPQEKSLLLSLGIDSMLENSLKSYLPDFFSSLQKCSSDTSLVLSRDCETSFFVLWSALFHNRAEIERRRKEGVGGVIDDLDLAQDAALISGLKPRRKDTIAKPLKPGVGKNTIKELFTLMFVNATPAPLPSDDVIRELFTLMRVDSE